ncbi:MAG: GNAT family N-acetyltransferase [Turneriella sp.]
MKKLNVQIRQLESRDYAAWLVLWRAYLAYFKTELTEKTTRTTWSRLTNPAEPMFALGAFSEAGELLGLVHCIYHRSCWTEGDYCYLQDIFTAENARGRGIATALIDAVCTRARADGASRVHWLTHETNFAAQKLYDKIALRSGFVQYRKVLSL